MLTPRRFAARNLFALALAALPVGAAFGAAAFIPKALPAAAAPYAEPAPAQVRQKLFHHLRYHQSFPVTRAALLALLQAGGELSAAEITWVHRHLPAQLFASEGAALHALFPTAPPRPAATALNTLAQR